MVSWSGEVKQLAELFSGQYLVSSQRNLVISTLLGSCVAVCLFDYRSGTGGMNHFLLPNVKQQAVLERSKEGNYGLLSLEKILDEFRKKGIDLRRLQAKVFGGARLIDVPPGREINADIAEANIKLALNFLQERKIPVTAKDVGGLYGRRIFFDLEDFSVYVKTLTQPLSSNGLSPQNLNNQSRQ